MTPALVAAAIAAPLLRPEPWSAVALQQASSPDGALHCSTAPNECKHSARASTGSRWPTEEVHARTLWPCTADGGGLSSVSAEPAALHSRLAIFWSAPFSCASRIPRWDRMFTFCSLLSVTNSPERSPAAGRGAEPSLPGTGQVLLRASLSAQLVAVRHRAVAALRAM